jgi:hypothetical protein
MKRETIAKRENAMKEMKKFKFDAGGDDDDGLLEELGGLEDDEEELEAAEEEPQAEEEDGYFNESFKRELEAYRE